MKQQRNRTSITSLLNKTLFFAGIFCGCNQARASEVSQADYMAIDIHIEGAQNEIKTRAEIKNQNTRNTRTLSLTRSSSDPNLQALRERQLSMQRLGIKNTSSGETVHKHFDFAKKDKKLGEVIMAGQNTFADPAQNAVPQKTSGRRWGKISRYSTYGLHLLAWGAIAGVTYVGVKLYGGCTEMQSDCDIAKTLMTDCSSVCQLAFNESRYWGAQIIQMCLQAGNNSAI